MLNQIIKVLAKKNNRTYLITKRIRDMADNNLTKSELKLLLETTEPYSMKRHFLYDCLTRNKKIKTEKEIK
jgi:hypothetical protein